jgi:hypothetical protein
MEWWRNEGEKVVQRKWMERSKVDGVDHRIDCVMSEIFIGFLGFKIF